MAEKGGVGPSRIQSSAAFRDAKSTRPERAFPAPGDRETTLIVKWEDYVSWSFSSFPSEAASDGALEASSDLMRDLIASSPTPNLLESSCIEIDNPSSP